MIGAILNPSGFARVSELRSLGVPFAVSTIWQKVSKKQFPAPVRIGHVTAWKIGDVLAWLEDQAAPAPAPADTESRGAKLTAVRLAKRQGQIAAPEQDLACAHACNSARGAA